jgi:hypothetical protein
MCILKFFGGINFRLVPILQLGIPIYWYQYVEWYPQTKQTSMCHVMMLQQQTILLLTLIMQIINIHYWTTSHYWGCWIWIRLNQLIWSFQNGHARVVHKLALAKDFQTLNWHYLKSWFNFYNIYKPPRCTFVHTCWRMAHHWEILC